MSFAVVGIVGGVGSGKSTLSRWVAERIPVVVIDGDRLGHEALEDANARRQIVSRFGEDLLDSDGVIVRSRLGQKVWGTSPAALNARRNLEEIVHPIIQQKISQQIEKARFADKQGVLLDAAVLLESNWEQVCDRIVFIDTPDQMRSEHVVSTRNWTVEQWQQRERSQMDLAEKRARADIIIDNSSSISNAGQQFLEYLNSQFDWN